MDKLVRKGRACERKYAIQHKWAIQHLSCCWFIAAIVSQKSLIDSTSIFEIFGTNHHASSWWSLSLDSGKEAASSSTLEPYPYPHPCIWFRGEERATADYSYQATKQKTKSWGELVLLCLSWMRDLFQICRTYWVPKDNLKFERYP